MTDLSNFSDEDLARAAGLPAAPVQTAPASAPTDPLSHLSDADLEKIAGGGNHPASPNLGQDDSWWREPKLAASNFAKGAIQSWAHMMDMAGTAQGVPGQAALNVMNEVGALDLPQKPLTDAVVNNEGKNLQVARDAGIIDRPELQPQSIPEKLLAAGSEGAGSAASMGMVGPRALLSAAGSGIGAKTGQHYFPDSSVAPLIGSLLGGLAPAGIEAAASGAGNLVKNAFGLYDPSARADQIIASKFAADKVDPAEVSSTIAQFPDKPVTLADVGGKATQRIARASLDIPSEAGAQATQFLENRDLGAGVNGEYDMFRQGGSADRIIGDVKQALGSDDAFKAASDLVAKQQADAGPLYDAFRASPPVPARQVQQFMTSPTFKSALARANASILDEGGEPLTSLVKFDEAGGPIGVKGAAFPPDTLDRIKQGIDDSWLAAKSSGDAGAARTANALRTRFLQFMDAKYPDTYPAARQAFAGPAVSLDALKQGADVFKTAPQDVAQTLQSLPAESQPMFRIGVQQAMLAKIQNTADGANEVRALFGKPATRASIAAAFDDPEALNQLSQNLGIENQMFKTKTNMLGNSNTAPRLADQADLQSSLAPLKNVGEATAHVMGGNIPGAAFRLFGPKLESIAARFGEGANSETTNLLAQRLFSPDSEANTARLQLIKALMDKQAIQPAGNPLAFLPYLSGAAATQESRQ